MINTDESVEIDRNKTGIKQTKSDLDKITETKLNGLIIRSKAQIVEQDEKNRKYFASLEKKRAECKVNSRFNVNGTIITDPIEVLNEQKSYYGNLYKVKEQTDSYLSFFDESIPKLNVNEKIRCEGLISDSECYQALKGMKNQMSRGSVGITTEFYKILCQTVLLLNCWISNSPSELQLPLDLNLEKIRHFSRIGDQ